MYFFKSSAGSLNFLNMFKVIKDGCINQTKFVAVEYFYN